MTRLASIIRFRKWDLDEKRKELAVRQGKLLEVDDRLADLRLEAAMEQNATGLEVSTTQMGAYLRGVSVREAALLEQRLEADRLVEEQRDIVAEAFQELKTFEIAAEEEEKRTKASRDKVEQDAFDETGLRKFTQPGDPDVQ